MPRKDRFCGTRGTDVWASVFLAFSGGSQADTTKLLFRRYGPCSSTSVASIDLCCGPKRLKRPLRHRMGPGFGAGGFLRSNAAGKWCFPPERAGQYFDAGSRSGRFSFTHVRFSLFSDSCGASEGAGDTCVAQLQIWTRCSTTETAAKQQSEYDLAPMNQHLSDCSQPFRRMQTRSSEAAPPVRRRRSHCCRLSWLRDEEHPLFELRYAQRRLLYRVRQRRLGQFTIALDRCQKPGCPSLVDRLEPFTGPRERKSIYEWSDQVFVWSRAVRCVHLPETRPNSRVQLSKAPRPAPPKSTWRLVAVLCQATRILVLTVTKC